MRDFHLGDRVCAEYKELKGGVARLALTDVKRAAKMPAEMTLPVAATIPIAGVTVSAAVEKVSAANEDARE